MRVRLFCLMAFSFMLGKAQNANKITSYNFKKSEIINFIYDKNLIYGTWICIKDIPVCSFEINEKRFLDYNADESFGMLYKLIKDSIFVDYIFEPNSILKGKIIKLNPDTLAIHWQNRIDTTTLLRLKKGK